MMYEVQSLTPSNSDTEQYAEDINSWYFLLIVLWENFLTPVARFLKTSQIVVVGICQILLFSDLMGNADIIVGRSFDFFHWVASFGMMTSVFLLISYIVSNQPFKLIRKSLLELVFGATAFCLYLCASVHLLVETLKTKNEYDSLDYVHPIWMPLIFISVAGLFLAGLHLIDACIALKDHRHFHQK